MEVSARARLLVVDDNGIKRQGVTRILKAADYEVIEAATGADGLRLAYETMPDLVLLDRLLPDIDGVEVCRQIKAGAHTSNLFVVFLSALRTSSDSQAAGLEGGADGYIAYPVGNRELVARVEAMLRIKHAEDCLRESEDKYKYVFDNSVAGKSITLPSGEIHVNRAFCEMLGYSPEELQSRKWQVITDPDDVEPTQRALDPLLNGEKDAVRFIKRYIHKDGSVVWADASTSVRRDETGKPLYFMTTVLDITEQKEAEEALRESEQRFSTAFFTNPVAQSIITPGSNEIMAVNDACCRLFEYCREELIGASTAKLSLWENPADRLATLEELQRTGHLPPREATIRIKSGEIRTVIVAIEPISWRGLACLISSVFDITERKRAEAALKEYSERLEDMVAERTRELYAAQERLVRQEKLAILGQLAGGVGHELRNPLGAIKNAVFFLNMALLEPGPEVWETLEILNQEVVACERIIGSLLDFARPRAPVPRRVDVNAIMRETLARTALPESVEVATHLDDTLPAIQADPDQLGMVFGNLLRNAVQAMPGGGRLSVTTRPVPSASPLLLGEWSGVRWVAVSVADTGVGIPEEDLPKLFEPLFSTKAQGIGLGLAVSKLLVAAHGGSVEVQSQVGQGSTFTVKLPAEQEKTA